MGGRRALVEGSYILRLLRDVSRVRRWRLAAGEGRESRRVVAEAVRSDLHILTHTYTHLRTRVSVNSTARSNWMLFYGTSVWMILVAVFTDGDVAAAC